MTPRQAAYGAIAAALAIAAAVAWFTVAGWRADSRALAEAQSRLAATLEAVQAERKFTAARSAEVAADESKLAAAVARLPARPVRLCSIPAPAARAPAARPESDGAAPGPGMVPRTVGGDPVQGPDVGPDVHALMLEAERVAAVGRAAQRDAEGLRAAYALACPSP